MHNELREMCMPPGPGKAYFRPLLCKGRIDHLPIFIVGINPATPIYPNQKGLEEYYNLITNYEAFMKLYSDARVAEGKKPLSKTRESIKSIVEWLSTKTPASIAETNIIPYPTEKAALLKKEPESVLNQGKDIFYRLLMHYQPEILILHGKSTSQMLAELLFHKGLVAVNEKDELLATILKMDYSANSPLAEFNYPDGESCSIVAYKHFKYYGPNGKDSSLFRGRIEELFNRGTGQPDQ